MNKTTGKVQPFTIAVPDADLDDLRRRLDTARLPPVPAGMGWRYGTDRPFMEQLSAHWRERYDWRAAERRLNEFPQFMADIDGYRVHFIHVKGSGRSPMPLVLTHGWPGSFVEFESVIDALAHPERYGGNEEDAFDVIVPSIPG